MILECYNLLKKIEKRPAIWTGETTLKSIFIYVNGYYQSLLDNKIAQNNETEEPFFDWVAKELGYYESTAGWVNMILAYVIGYETKNINWENFLANQITNEQHIKSISCFYELIEKFKMEIEK
jgi:hypothetical protein